MMFNTSGIFGSAMECWIHIVGMGKCNFNKFRLFKIVVVFCRWKILLQLLKR